MAALLDISLLNFFNVVFPFLLVFAVVFSILQARKLISDNAGINAIIAFVFAGLAVLVESVRALINMITPWFVALFIVIILILIVFSAFGLTEKDFKTFITSSDKEYVVIIIVSIAALIVLVSLGSLFGQKLLEKNVNVSEVSMVNGSTTATSSFEKNFYSTLFHPKVLGLIFILLVGVFAIKQLTTE